MRFDAMRICVLVASVQLFGVGCQFTGEGGGHPVPDGSVPDCETNAECLSADKSLCDTVAEQCIACSADADCSHIEGKNVCDDGLCVECTAENYSACTDGTKVCDGAARECTDRDIREKQACESCIADVECLDGMLCVTEVFDETELGAICLWRQDAEGAGAPNGSCTTNARPYFSSVERQSIDGVEAMVCTLRTSTCLAHEQFSVQGSCSGENDHEACGHADLDDGYCVDSDPGAGTDYRCTVPCGASEDCPINFDTCEAAPVPISGKICAL